jgi:hypothetical protein
MLENNFTIGESEISESVKVFEYRKVIPKYKVDSGKIINFIDNLESLEAITFIKKDIQDSREINSSVNEFITNSSTVTYELRTKELRENKTIFESLTTTHEKKYNTNTVDKEIVMEKSRELIRILSDDNSMIGYTSNTQIFIKQLIDINKKLAGEIILQVNRSIYHSPLLLAKLIEAISNIDYEIFAPYNYSVIQASLHYDDIEVQEAVIAAYEKWEDPENVTFLENTTFSNKFISNYAKEVICYLRGL